MIQPNRENILKHTIRVDTLMVKYQPGFSTFHQITGYKRLFCCYIFNRGVRNWMFVRCNNSNFRSIWIRNKMPSRNKLHSQYVDSNTSARFTNEDSCVSLVRGAAAAVQTGVINKTTGNIR